MKLTIRPGFPDFLDLPWDSPLEGWGERCSCLQELPRGISRHTVVFVNYRDCVYAFKELPPDFAEKEYRLLSQMETQHLPAVTPVGWAMTETARGRTSVLITRYLDGSLPYRTLFMHHNLRLYRQHLLNAIASLLVQLHLAGVYWGDCSLSNTLFRRDAGTLQAYLVDAETAEIPAEGISPILRFHDLEIMEENIDGDLLDLASAGLLPETDPGIPFTETGAYIRLRYQSLWEEITREVIIHPNERYRIQEHIQALNSLGFSVKNVELAETEAGNQLRLRVMVADRSFHREQLCKLTGLDVEEMQARAMMNEIQQVRAVLSQQNYQSIPLSSAASHWLENFYSPVVKRIASLADDNLSLAELYCQILEHKWYLSEKAQYDVGHQFAVDDFLRSFGRTGVEDQKN